MTLATAAGGALRDVAQAATRRSVGLQRHTIQINGWRVAYCEAGAEHASTIVMLHGFSADGDVWARFASGLRGHRVIVPDLPGHGHTGFTPGAGYSAPAQADRVLALLDALGIERAHVIGNSMGGFISATLARRAPERVISLGLVDAAGVLSTELSPLGHMLERGENPFLMDDPGQFDAFYAMTMQKPPFVPGLVRAAIAQEYVERRAQLAEIFGDFHEHDLLDSHLAEIPAPTWVAWGRHDQLIHVSAADVWAGGLPDASKTVYADLGHMPMFEAPRRTARDYAAFLATVAGSASA